MEQTLGMILIIIGGVVTLVALFTVLSLLIPRTADRIRTVMLEHPMRSFLVGLVNFFFSAAVAGLLAQQIGKVRGLESVFAILAFLILGWLIVPALAGAAGIVSLLRERMMAGGQNNVRGTMKASLLLVLAALVPFVGWFVFTPVALLTGLGAALFALFRREQPQVKIPPPTQAEGNS
jgi:hypothetical protein